MSRFSRAVSITSSRMPKRRAISIPEDAPASPTNKRYVGCKSFFVKFDRSVDDVFIVRRVNFQPAIMRRSDDLRVDISGENNQQSPRRAPSLLPDQFPCRLHRAERATARRIFSSFRRYLKCATKTSKDSPPNFDDRRCPLKPICKREFAHLCAGTGNPEIAIKLNNPAVFITTVLPPAFAPEIIITRFFLRQFELKREQFLFCLVRLVMRRQAQIFFQDRMPRLDQIERFIVGDLRHNRVEFSREFDFRFDEIEFGDGFDRRFDRRKLFAQIFG